MSSNKSAWWIEQLKYIKPLSKKKNTVCTLENCPVFVAADFETSLIYDAVDKVEKHSIIGWSLKTDRQLTKTVSVAHNLITQTQHLKISDESEETLILDFWNMLQKIHKNKIKSKYLYVYMHNLGSFDGILLVNVLDRLKILSNSKQLIIRNNTVYEISIGQIIFRDFYKLLPESLSTLAKKILNIEKYKFDPNWLIDFNSIKYNERDIIHYMKKDSFILYHLVTTMNAAIVQQFGVCISECKTISGLSYKIYRKSFLMNDKLIANSALFSDNVQQIIKQSYRGGIVDVYKPEGENLYQYDINSSYAHAMKNYMPVGLPSIVPKQFVNNLDINSFFGFLVVKVMVQYDYIPFLGIKNSKISSNIYPYGIFKISVFSEELKYAIEINQVQILEIYSAVKFEKSYLFNKFVDSMYTLRLNSKDKVEKNVYKNILNYLYGRMGLKNEVDRAFYLTSDEKKIMNVLAEATRIGNTNIYTVSTENIRVNDDIIETMVVPNKTKEILKQRLKKLTKNTIYTQTAVHIASAITAYSRINIDKYKRQAIQMGGQIYYSDTDSIVTDVKMQTSDNMGKLKLERKIKWAYHIAPKAYIHVNHIDHIVAKFKGINLQELKINNSYDTMNKFKDYVTKVKENSSVGTTYLYDVPIKKDFKTMRIVKTHKMFSSVLIIKKRLKVSTVSDKWLDTLPIEIK